MNPGQLMKVTYHTDTKKINKYIKFTSVYHQMLESVLENCPYEHDGGVRLFWIDDENDEIDITNQDSLFTYETFTSGVERRHLHVAKVKSDEGIAKAAKAEQPCTIPTVNQAEMPPAAGSYEFAVHDNVECDGCLMAPIIGFRYKCIQCANYDLCQNCESKHIHSEHMMVRMPTNNCPSVVETYITGRSSGRKSGRRSKASCPFVKNGLSVVIDDDGEGSQPVGGCEGSEQATTSNGKERHHGRRHHHRRHPRHNFLHNLYEMMHDLAEGGGAAAAAHAMGEEEEPAKCSTKTTTTTTGPHTTTTQSTCNDKNIDENISIAQVAAQQAHEAAVKAAEIAAKVAHETAIQTAKNIAVSMSATPSAPTADANSTDNDNKNCKDKVDATTSPRMNNTSVPSSPSLEALTQFLDPQYMKTGIQILNNFSDMFAKMLDPLDNEVSGSANKAPTPSSSFSCPFNTNGSRKNSTASAKSTVSSQQNSINSEKNSEHEKSIEKQQTKEVIDEEETKQSNKQTESEVSSNVEIEDLGSDSESDSVSESFIKLEAPKEASLNKSDTSTASTSAQTTPPQSLNKSNVMDFAQLSADLKAHIAEEAAKGTGAATGTPVAKTDVNAAEQAKANTTANTTEPVVSATTSTPRNQERRAIPVYHADEHINNAVLAMMAMGFSNEGAWLTQLLETVNGNIDEALELMPVDPRGGGR
ncbi:hypothetical protein DOY81_000433 [Sarcophaga bullata]|nr:hypothetical protein DOY81_000433 [Sarcophaga bullata]